MLIKGNNTSRKRDKVKCFVHSNCFVFTVCVPGCASVTQAEQAEHATLTYCVMEQHCTMLCRFSLFSSFYHGNCGCFITLKVTKGNNFSRKIRRDEKRGNIKGVCLARISAIRMVHCSFVIYHFTYQNGLQSCHGLSHLLYIYDRCDNLYLL